jgi:hypothetical protein
MPRRVSGPARPATPPPGRPSTGPATRPRRRARAARSWRPHIHPGALLGRATSAVRSLPDHRLLDRLVRGRAWISLLGAMLVLVVFMQVEVLKLGASIGRSIDRGTELQSRNELLRASVAALADDQRIERIAASMGMVMPGPTDVGFVPSTARGAVRKAIAGISPVDSQTFLARLAAEQASNAAAGPQSSASTLGATGTATPGTTTPGTSTGSPTGALAATPTGAAGGGAATSATSPPAAGTAGTTSVPSTTASGGVTTSTGGVTGTTNSGTATSTGTPVGTAATPASTTGGVAIPAGG